MRNGRARGVLEIVFCLALAGGSCTSPTGPSRIGPSIASVAPNHGTTFGGTAVTISGANFFAPVSVSFGGTEATGVTLVDNATITAVAPVHVTGSVDIAVTANSRSAMLSGGFVYESPTVANTPPRIESLTASGRRRNEPPRYAAVDETIDLRAAVVDDETPLSMLTFQWSAPAGTFMGDNVATFTAPHAPGTVTATFTVTERFLGPDPSGLPVQMENKASANIAIRVHDEVKEVSDMARDFLVLFSQSSVAPATVVHNFQEGCGANGTGKQDELQQTAANRENFVILPDWFVGQPRTTIDFGGVSPFRARLADAWSAVDVKWHAQCLKKDASIGCSSVGMVGEIIGVDWVTAHFDGPTDRWWLCDSDFQSNQTLWPNLTAAPIKPFLR